ncbi:MAG: ABC transporter substrate-binding protein [Dictyoglomi bacterium]|nr:ABC transporter substrate-binding protein [Dictyoglomota bacterium]
MKRFLATVIGALLVLSLILGSFSITSAEEAPFRFQYTTPTEYQKMTGKRISGYKEAPMLTELVKQGKLPPVERRLPKEPAIVKPLEEIGQYGGTWKRAATGISDVGTFVSEVTHQYFLRCDKDPKTPAYPNLIKRYTASKDNTTFTFYLREGLRWSDGELFTADDVIFYYEDILLNKELTPMFPVDLSPGGKPAVFEKVDNYTFRVTFSSPSHFFIQALGEFSYYRELFAPKHYLRQFHPRYVSSDKLQAMAKEAGFERWDQLFNNKADWQNPDKPVVYAWKVKQVTPSAALFERNPYFWKVDAEGNQLPYIDNVRVEILSNAEVINLRAVAGELDCQDRHIFFANYPVFMENRSKGNYKVIKWMRTAAAEPAICLNQNVKNPMLRKLFTDVRFRIALSVAINREEINQLVYLGMGKVKQAALGSTDYFYDPEWEKAYIEYNPEMANKLLDEIGLTKRDKDGFRLDLDGKPLYLTIETYPAFAQWVDVADLVKGYWGKIGLRTEVKVEDASLYTTRATAGEVEIGAYPFDGDAVWGLGPAVINFLGLRPACCWAPLYGLWYSSKGKGGETPTGDIKKLYELWDKAMATTNRAKMISLVREAVALHKKNIWMIGTVGEWPMLCIVKDNFRNVLEGVVQIPRFACPEQYFFKK